MKKEEMLITMIYFFLKGKNEKDIHIKVIEFDKLCKKSLIPDKQVYNFLEKVIFQVYTSAIVQGEFIPTSKELNSGFLERDFEKANENLVNIVNKVYKTKFHISYNPKGDKVFLMGE